MKKRVLSLLIAGLMIMSSNVYSVVSASNEKAEENVIVSEEKPPPSTEKRSEQLINAMNSGASIFEVQIMYTDVSTIEEYAIINNLVDEYREKLESEGVEQIGQKCLDYRRELEAELVLPKRIERAEKILIDIGADVSKAVIYKKTPTIDCDLDLEQLTKALEHKAIYYIMLRSEIKTPDIPMTTVNPSVSPTTTTTVVPVKLAGDANCDGIMTIADAAAIMQAIGNPDNYALSEQGEFNADSTGDGLTVDDAVAIQKKLAGIAE